MADDDDDDIVVESYIKSNSNTNTINNTNSNYNIAESRNGISTTTSGSASVSSSSLPSYSSIPSLLVTNSSSLPSQAVGGGAVGIKGEGEGEVVKREGATVRDGVDVDVCAVVGR